MLTMSLIQVQPLPGSCQFFKKVAVVVLMSTK